MIIVVQTEVSASRGLHEIGWGGWCDGVVVVRGVESVVRDGVWGGGRWAASHYETYRFDSGIDRLTGPYRNSHPQESREAELVHEHSHASGELRRGTGAQ